MANTNNIPDPNTVPGSEGLIPATDQGFRDDPAREDPAGTGVDSDGTDEALGEDPLHPENRSTDKYTAAGDQAHIMHHIPDPSDNLEDDK